MDRNLELMKLMAEDVNVPELRVYIPRERKKNSWLACFGRKTKNAQGLLAYRRKFFHIMEEGTIAGLHGPQLIWLFISVWCGSCGQCGQSASFHHP